MGERSSGRRVPARVALVFVAAALFVGGLAFPARANHATRYQQLQEDIRDTRAKIRDAQRRERNLMQLIAESDARRARLESTIASLGDQLGAANARLAQLTASLDVVSARLALETLHLEEALAHLEEQRALVDQRAAHLYINSINTYTTVLLNVQDFSDFMAGEEYTQRVLDTDVQLLQEIEQAKADVSARRDSVEKQRDALRKQQGLIRAEAARIAGIQRRQAATRVLVVNEIGYRQKLLAGVRTQKEAYLRALRSMLEESSSIEAMLKGAQKGQTVIAGAGHGYLVWPTSGRVTSPYGWRTHPIYGYRSFHTGIDIGASSGQRVVAARFGEVLYTGYKGAYGLVVIIDHGKSVATVYAHLSKVYVRSGQWVSTRQAIAAVGSTGWSTGPHLHFEVRVSGEHVNPTRYL